MTITLSTTSAATPWLDTNSKTIQYRFDVIGPTGIRQCVMEFRSRDDVKSYVSLNLSVDYRWQGTQTWKGTVVLGSDGGRLTIPNCAGISDVYVQYN